MAVSSDCLRLFGKGLVVTGVDQFVCNASLLHSCDVILQLSLQNPCLLIELHFEFLAESQSGVLEST